MNVNIATAARLLCSLQAKKVLVLGDVMLDRFVDGAVTRISPEAPVPILSQSRVRQMPGGAANVACAGKFMAHAAPSVLIRNG